MTTNTTPDFISINLPVAAELMDTVTIENHPEWDDTFMYTDDREAIQISQKDEHGVIHDIILFPDQLALLLPHMLRWALGNVLR
jgi:hypothetical protein